MRVRSIAVALFAVSTIALSGCASGATSESASSSSAVVSTSANAAAEAPADGGGAVGESSAKPTNDGSDDTKMDDGATCGDASASAAASTAVDQLPAPTDVSPDATWTTAAADLSGYDPCAELSWIILSMDGATGSSPYAIALFHDGEFIGPATTDSYAFFPEITRIDQASISVTYRYLAPEDANASPSLTATSTFTYEDGEVVRSGDLPQN